MCINHFKPASKGMTMEWRHPGSLHSRKVHSALKAGKIMFSFFFDERPLLIYWIQRGATINAERYCNTLLRLKQTIRNKCRDKLSNGIVIPQNNARSNSGQEAHRVLWKFRWRSCNTFLTAPASSHLKVSPCDPQRSHGETLTFTTQFQRNWVLLQNIRTFHCILFIALSIVLLC